MIHATIKEIDLSFWTEDNVFSPMAIDAGTLAMLSKVDMQKSDKVLDLGCGYGVVGILAAKLIGEGQVTMCDNSKDAVELAKGNAERNGLAQIRTLQSDGLKEIADRDFTLILCNPPYHTDFSVAKSFIEDGFKKLAIGGRMVMVTKRLDWYKNKLATVFGGVRVHEVEDYFVFISEKRAGKVIKKEKPKNTLSKKLQRKYAK